MAYTYRNLLVLKENHIQNSIDILDTVIQKQMLKNLTLLPPSKFVPFEFLVKSDTSDLVVQGVIERYNNLGWIVNTHPNQDGVKLVFNLPQEILNDTSPIIDYTTWRKTAFSPWAILISKVFHTSSFNLDIDDIQLLESSRSALNQNTIKNILEHSNKFTQKAVITIGRFGGSSSQISFAIAMEEVIKLQNTPSQDTHDIYIIVVAPTTSAAKISIFDQWVRKLEQLDIPFISKKSQLNITFKSLDQKRNIVIKMTSLNEKACVGIDAKLIVFDNFMPSHISVNPNHILPGLCDFDDSKIVFLGQEHGDGKWSKFVHACDETVLKIQIPSWISNNNDSVHQHMQDAEKTMTDKFPYFYGAQLFPAETHDLIQMYKENHD